MMDRRQNSAPRVMDPLGRLLFQGQEVASYLFQVPDDKSEWQKLSAMVDQIIRELSTSARVELPQIAQEMKQLLAEDPSISVADQLVAGFDRMVKLWKSARSGLMDASRLSNLGSESPPNAPRSRRKRGEPVLWD